MSYVDLDAFIDYTLLNKKEFVWVTHPILPNNLPSYFADRMVALSGFNHLIAQGQQSGELNLGRERVTLFSDYKRGDVLFNATRVNRIDATNNQDLIQAEVELREQVISLTQFARKYLPGFSQASLSGAASRVGIRESRRIIGDYVLNEEDVLHGRQFADGIAKGCFPIDIHSPHDKTNVWTELEDAYDIPYRSLLPVGLDNVLVFGWITRLAYLNVLWILFSLLGLGLFGITPATAAMYAVVRKWLRGEEDVAVFNLFIKTFRSEFWRCQGLGIMLLLVTILLATDIHFFSNYKNGSYLIVKCITIGICLLFILLFGYLFPVFAHFEGTIASLVKNAFILSVSNPSGSLLLLIGGIILVMVWMIFPATFLFLGGSTFACWGTWIANKSFRRIEELRNIRIQ